MSTRPEQERSARIIKRPMMDAGDALGVSIVLAVVEEREQLSALACAGYMLNVTSKMWLGNDPVDIFGKTTGQKDPNKDADVSCEVHDPANQTLAHVSPQTRL